MVDSYWTSLLARLNQPNHAEETRALSDVSIVQHDFGMFGSAVNRNL